MTGPKTRSQPLGLLPTYFPRQQPAMKEKLEQDVYPRFFAAFSALLQAAHGDGFFCGKQVLRRWGKSTNSPPPPHGSGLMEVGFRNCVRCFIPDGNNFSGMRRRVARAD